MSQSGISSLDRSCIDLLEKIISGKFSLNIISELGSKSLAKTVLKDESRWCAKVKPPVPAQKSTTLIVSILVSFYLDFFYIFFILKKILFKIHFST